MSVSGLAITVTGWDLDRAGLRIAASAARQAARAGLPPVLPATGCYQFLLGGPHHWRRPDGSNRRRPAK